VKLAFVINDIAVAGSAVTVILGAFAELRKADISFVLFVRPSVRPRETIRLPLDGFSCNLIFEGFLKICRENSSSVKKNNGYFTRRPMHIYDNIANALFVLRCAYIF
jgi:hypothetical protein